ncbi:sensor histidine kinase [Propionibacterium australiense]|uniref:histidine kinase n=1 Tax=Propionibacterium australiense TaxID=119981 RepID=A0A383S8H3_9ACTN|nr:ATP-binding protein [Propionibacterium australiense]RLP09659.1 histidine kinase [Propionibacterium australiense]RLP12361.1 histidine kinase [Propionibacterium australiense]SYZ33566.1 Histidine kinase [Propionibacterium australiense]VEH89561.1 Sensor histidine kinase desK [Propionibacterium australiense]
MEKRERPWRRWAFALGATALGAFFLMVTGLSLDNDAGSVVTLLIVVAVAALGCWLAMMGLAEQRRHRRQMISAAAAEAVLKDRLLIAGQLHDIISHGLGAITLRARVGARSDELIEAHAALGDVIGLSQQATTELRQVLTVLREPGTSAPLSPTAGIAELSEVIEQARSHGVALRVSGLDARCSSATGLVVHHVVREALRNITRHVGPTSAECSITRSGNRVVVRVEDEGPHRPVASAPGAGHGLGLLRQRVQVVGGTLTHGPTGNGFVVEASIPDEGPAA